MRASAPTQGSGGVWQTGRVLAGQGAAPLRRLRRHLPLQGRLLVQGEVDAPEGADGGGVAGWRRRYPARSGRGLPRIRRGRCWHRPANLAAAPGSAAGEIARPTKRPQAGGDAEAAVVRQVRRRADASIGPYAGERGSVADRKGIGGARCGTPPSPAATPPLAGEAFGRQCPQRPVGPAVERILRADASIGPYAGGRGSVADRKGIGGARCGTPPSPAATPPLAGEAFGLQGKRWGQKGQPPRRRGRAEGAGGQKKRSPALKVSMGPDQRARTAAALSLV